MDPELQRIMDKNPLIVIAENWYDYPLSPNRVRKLNRLLRRFLESLPPRQGSLEL